MTQCSNKKKVELSVADWHQAACDGINLPIRFQVNGSSMQPFIRKNRDFVTVVPLRRPPRVGDIVLFYRESKSDYVLHRIRRTKGNMVQPLGDGCYSPDPWMSTSNIRGLVIIVERGKLRIDPNNKLWHTTAYIWMTFWHARKWAIPLMRPVVRFIKLCKRAPNRLHNK